MFLKSLSFAAFVKISVFDRETLNMSMCLGTHIHSSLARSLYRLQINHIWIQVRKKAVNYPAYTSFNGDDTRWFESNPELEGNEWHQEARSPTPPMILDFGSKIIFYHTCYDVPRTVFDRRVIILIRKEKKNATRTTFMPEQLLSTEIVPNKV